MHATQCSITALPINLLTFYLLFDNCRYPFQGSHLIKHELGVKLKLFRKAPHNLLGARMLVSSPTWESWIEAKSDPFFIDHKIQGTTVFPGAAYVEMALAAVQEHDSTRGNVFSALMEPNATEADIPEKLIKREGIVGSSPKPKVCKSGPNQKISLIL